MATRRGNWLLCACLHLLSGALNTNVGVEGRNEDGSCYDELGCFPLVAPWFTILRPFPAPWEPTKIDTTIYYFSRTTKDNITMTLWPSISLNGADFKSDRPTTIITHGFASSGKQYWLAKLKDNYLKRLDANIFIVDWGKGAKHMNYLQVAANTRVVGAEVGRFVKWLVDHQGLKPSTVHLLGHSLGAHICAYVAKRVPGIGRITGFDPAQPGFETAKKEVRLDKSDAGFVEILHTNALPVIPLLGFGLMYPKGHVDFYINGGAHQPGCKTAVDIMKDMGKGLSDLKNITSVLKQTVEDLVKLVGCSHGRSYTYYIEALNNNSCKFWGHQANMARRMVNGATVGFLEPLFQSLRNCTEESCVPIGLETINYKGRGSFAVATNQKPPFCQKDNTAGEVLEKINKAVLNAEYVYKNVTANIRNIGRKARSFLQNIQRRFPNPFG